jgi:uncharacterized membrane protein YkgB
MMSPARPTVADDPRYQRLAGASTAIRRAGAHIARVGLAINIGWIGLLKFYQYEAEGIRGLVANSPLMSWMYAVWSVQGVSNVIGTVEVTAALLILLRPWSARAAAAGSLIAVVMFLTTLSFLFTTPGVVQPPHGFPALSGAGGFLLKDLVLLGVALWSFGEAAEQIIRGAAGRSPHVHGDADRRAQ